MRECAISTRPREPSLNARPLVFLAVVLAAFAAAPAAAEIPAPASWRSQAFEFPLAFAPSLPYEGREQVRFAPSWPHFAAEEGFSYVVLWDLKPTLMEAAPLERALDVYFDGLMNAAAAARHLRAMVPQTAVTLHPLAVPKGWNDGYAGKVRTWNGFGNAEDLTLNVEITQRTCGPDRLQVFYAISKAPRGNPVWATLRAVRNATTCAS